MAFTDERELSAAERGVSVDTDPPVVKEIRKMRDEKTQDARIDAAREEIDQEVNEERVHGLHRAKQQNETNWKKLTEAIKLDPKSIKEDSKAKTCGGFVNMGYLTVLLGCELDLYGFVMACRSYWDLELPVVRILLIVMPAGYLIAVLMYMFYAEEIIARLKKSEEGSVSIQATNPVLKRRPSGSSLDGVAKSPPAEPDIATPANLADAYAKRPRVPVNMRYYHFLPVFRFYCIVKEKEESDIEAIFRVNSLSSFTMGIAQLAAIVFTQIGGGDMNFFVQLNIFSQAVNWLITFVYFLTPISSLMSGQLKVETLNRNTEDDMRNLYQNYLAIQVQVSEGKRSRQELDVFAKRVDAEIHQLSHTDESLAPLEAFGMFEKIDALRLLRRKNNIQYAKIGN